jgi:hypothetical protein
LEVAVCVAPPESVNVIPLSGPFESLTVPLILKTKVLAKLAEGWSELRLLNPRLFGEKMYPAKLGVMV